MRGDFRDAPGLLDGAIACRFVDRRWQPHGERHEYSDWPGERGAAVARLHRVGRCELLQRAGDDDHQRQHDHVADGRFHRHDSALRHEHGLSLQPDRTARAERRDRLREPALLVGRARQHGQLAQSHVRWRLGSFGQRAAVGVDSRFVVWRGRKSRAEQRRVG
jgi:hypothetical protein